jgi:putative transposase
MSTFKIAATTVPNRIAAALKGYTSRILRQEFSELKSKLPTLWSRSYFVSTHGHVSTDTVEKYIEEQQTTR